jgi:predicted nucleic acid-binding protein
VSFLTDTNILLRLTEPSDPDYALVRGAVDTLVVRGEGLYYAAQNLVEFWNVCTRPTVNNGLGLSSAETAARAEIIERSFRLLPDTERVHAEWRRLVVAYQVAGKQVHDTRLAACMLCHGVTNILTLNDRDFKRYSGISAVHPREILRGVIDEL